MAEKANREQNINAANALKILREDCRKKDISYRAELLKALKDECHKCGIPYMYLEVTGHENKKAEYYCDGITPGSMGIELADDRIKKALNVLSGLDSIARVTAEEIGAEFDAMYDDVEVSSDDEWDQDAADAAERKTNEEAGF